MIRPVVIVCSLLLTLSYGRPYFDYDACEGENVGRGYYNLAGERSYNRNVELICDFKREMGYDYDRVMDIAWIKLGDGGRCSRAEAIRGDIDVNSLDGRSVLTIPRYDDRDYGVYRCFGTVRQSYRNLGRYRGQSDHVFMDVMFMPDDFSGSSRYARAEALKTSKVSHVRPRGSALRRAVELARAAQVAGALSRHPLRRLLLLLRLGITMSCLILTGYQSLELLNQFWTEPTATAFSRLPADRMPMPSVTVCPNGRGLEFREMPLNESSTSEWLWNHTVSLREMVVRCAHDCSPGPAGPLGLADRTADSPTGTWHSWAVDRAYSTCHTFTPNISMIDLLDVQRKQRFNPIEAAEWDLFQLEIRMKPSGGMSRISASVFFHRANEAQVTNPGFLSFEPSPRIYLEPDDIVTVRLRSELTQRESLYRAPCLDQAGYDRSLCLTRCLYDTRAARYGCRSPQMIDSHPHLTECRRPEALEMTLTLTEEAECGCPRACREHVFIATVSDRQYMAPHETSDIGYILVLAGRQPHMETTESAAYRLVNLLSEVGGYVGLLVGVSVMSLLQLLIDLAERLHDWCRRDRVLPLTVG
ncbi:hypothetical protein FJT64_002766 [Amphibalanus amphitrite]|uniref:Ig-like domain-containing protein n=1 Tax=Amphibalanus amphitrite TaxID=1232801 RepID=A0A6A4WKU6_AMPAM|nr:hypothetical protein FJT64_002766 [Amphibalanus amphitrite]